MTQTTSLWSCPRCKRRLPQRYEVCRCGEPRPAAFNPAPRQSNLARRLYEDWYVRGAIILVLGVLSYLKALRLMKP